jgi:hypothetical protein
MDQADSPPTANPTAVRPPLPLGKRIRRLLLVNVVSLTALGLLGEVALQLLWRPKYWITAEGWGVGAGQSAAGKKWWPNATYRIEGREFRTRFRTNALGYRARPEPPRTADPYRVAFVGDSFTEAMQVEYEDSFVARLETALAGAFGDREVVCENLGVAATGLFDYWHRIVHDVLRPGDAPDALVLCLYPGNDFVPDFPDEGFDADGRPRREYFRPVGPTWHALTWLNLKSKLAHFAIHAVAVAHARHLPEGEAPPRWFADPKLAASAPGAMEIRRARAILRAIEDECDRHGTRLVVLVVGPVPTYVPGEAGSPLGAILADWGVRAPVIDAAAWAVTAPGWPGLLYPRDGHLNPDGHTFIAGVAAGPLRRALAEGTAALAAQAGSSRVSR